MITNPSRQGLNPIALTKAKIACNFGLSECSRVKKKYFDLTIHCVFTKAGQGMQSQFTHGEGRQNKKMTKSLPLELYLFTLNLSCLNIRLSSDSVTFITLEDIKINY